MVSVENYYFSCDIRDVDRLPALRLALKRYFAKATEPYEAQRELAARVGLSQQSISNIACGEGNVTVRHLAMLAELQGKSVGVVLAEVGSVLAQIEAETPVRTLAAAHEPAPVTPTPTLLPTVRMFRIAAGVARDAIRTDEEVEVPDEAQRAAKGNLTGCYALRIEGESMSGDDLHDGDTVLVRAVQVYGRAGIYVVHLKSTDEVTLKRVRRTKSTMRLSPSNPAMSEMQFPAEDVEIQGVVVATISTAPR